MFKPGANPFDPSKITEMFGSVDMKKFFDPSAMGGFDQSALFAAQKKNMEALVSAQKAAAAGYQDLFEKQVSVFQETMKAAQAQIADMTRAEPGAESAAKQAELTSKAFEKAVANAQELAESAHRANTEAYEIVRARIESSVKELTANIS